MKDLEEKTDKQIIFKLFTKSVCGRRRLFFEQFRKKTTQTAKKIFIAY